jgi:hypothetical protein
MQTGNGARPDRLRREARVWPWLTGRAFPENPTGNPECQDGRNGRKSAWRSVHRIGAPEKLCSVLSHEISPVLSIFA